MHELGIAQKIVTAANDAAKKNNIEHVSIVRLRLGLMAAAHADQLQFGFDANSRGTRLEGAKLVIEEVEVELQCGKCRHTFTDNRFHDHEFAHTIAHAPMVYDPPQCPKCASSEAKIVHGREIELTNLEGK